MGGSARAKSRLGPNQLAAIHGYGAKAHWPDGFSIYQTGAPADGIFVVTSGSIVLRTVKGKRKFVPALVFPGETFGGEGLASCAKYATDAQAAEATDTLHITGERFRALLRERPAQALDLIGQAFTERTALLQRIHEVCASSVDERITSAILRLFEGRTAGGEDRLILGPADHRLLCEVVGATRESITHALARLVIEGVATREGPAFVVSKSKLVAQRGLAAYDVAVDRAVTVEAATA